MCDLKLAMEIGDDGKNFYKFKTSRYFLLYATITIIELLRRAMSE